MSHLDGILTEVLPTLLLQSTLILVGAFAATRLLSGAAAAARHVVWTAALAGLLLLPLAGEAGPRCDLALLPPIGASTAPAVALPGEPGTSGTRIQDPPSVRNRATGVIPERSPHPARGRAVPQAEAPAPNGDAAGRAHPVAETGVIAFARLYRSRSTGILVLAIYLLGASLVLVHLGLGLLRVRFIRRRAQPLGEDPSWRPLLAELGPARASRIRLHRSQDVEVPFTWGLLRPSILLPWESAGWSLQRRRDTLTHELSHVDRLDWLIQLSARLVCALYWFHPLVWLASRKLFLEAERACDDRVLASGARSHDYAQHLLELAARMRASRVRLEGAVAMARRRQLPVRIEAILDDKLKRSTMSTRKKLLVGVLTMAPVLFLAPVHLTQALAAQEGAAAEGARAERPVPAEKPVPDPIRAMKRTSPPAAGTDQEGIQSLRGIRRAADRLRHAARDAGHGSDQPVNVEATGDMTPLMVASARGDLDTVRALVDREEGRADLDEGRPGLGTPLILAANNGHLEVVRFLLDRGADANAWETGTPRVDGLPRSALTAAARAGHEEIVQLLLDRGARVDATPGHDATALMEAAGHGYAGISRLLLDRGAGVNKRVIGEGTALIAAARGGGMDIVRMLLDRGADPRGSSPGDGNPLIAAASNGDDEMVRLLLDRGARPDDWVDGDESGFFHAVAAGDTRMIGDMIDAGADVDAMWQGDGTPLIIASERGDPEIVDALLSAGAHPDVGMTGDGNPLIAAAGRGSLSLVKRMVDSGADVNSSVVGDGSPLIMAARGGHLEVVTYLVNAGAEVDMAVKGDENPLVAASGAGHLDVVKFLVGRGADVNARFVEHGEVRTPLSMALQNGHQDVAEYLRFRGARD